MKSREEGFTLVELMITMVVTVLTIAGASLIFVPLMTQFKQQSKVAETNIEGIVGLELMRTDIEGAGYGLPWLSQNALNYTEAVSTPGSTYNDAPANLPRAFVSGNNVSLTNILDKTDYLVLKSMVMGRSDTGQKWTYVSTGSAPMLWPSDALKNGDRVIVMKPMAGANQFRQLVMNGSVYYTTFATGGLPAAFTPQKPGETFLIYGADEGTLSMPFNRSDYFVSTQNVPTRCAPFTGVLRKSVLNHTDGTFTGGALPLLDCVADMQVTYCLDTDGDGIIDTMSDDISNIAVFTPDVIRSQLIEVRVYIVAQEGQKDLNFDFSMNNTRDHFTVTEAYKTSTTTVQRTFDLVNLKTQVGDPEYKYYRWKLYTMVVKPNNLR